MCLAIPGKVKKIDKMKAWIEYPQVKVEREAMIGEKGIKVGDWVMVQMGIVVKRLSEQEAEEMLKGCTD